MPTNTYIDASDVASVIKKIQGSPANAQAVTAVANAAGQTWTAAAMLGGTILRSGATTVSDTTATAAALVAAFPGVAVGSVCFLSVRNGNSGVLTILAGNNVTLEGTTTVTNALCREYAIRFTNVTAGSEAVTLSGLMTAAV